MDETGITANPKGAAKIIALRGKRQVGVLKSGGKGETITGQICLSAANVYMPQMLIFTKKRMQQALWNLIVSGGWVGLNHTGWINMKLFFVSFK